MIQDQFLPSYHSDGRAERLERWRCVTRSDDWRLLVWTGSRVTDHIRLVLAHMGYQARWDGLKGEEPGQWARALNLDRALSQSAEDFLNLLSEVLVLLAPDVLASALALDYYKVAVDGLDPAHWDNSEVGELVHRMKYWTDDPQAQESALIELSTRMAAVIERHPLYRETLIIQVPGHDSNHVSWGERLAESVAGLTGLQMVRAQTRRSQRPPAKERQDRRDLWEEFQLASEVSGRTVLAIDDTYGQGDTLKGVALAAKRAGAMEVHALLATRNIRK